jgi:hypothetical protein
VVVRGFPHVEMMLIICMPAGLPGHDAVQEASGRQIRSARIPTECDHLSTTDAAPAAIRARVM